MTFGAYSAALLYEAKLKHGAKLTPEKLEEVLNHAYRTWQQKHRREVHAVSETGARDPLFDALATAEGSNPTELTRGAARRIAVALASIKKATPAVTPEEITRRAVRYREIYPRVVVTANALEASWPKLNCFRFKAPVPPSPIPEAVERTPNVFSQVARDLGLKTE